MPEVIEPVTAAGLVRLSPPAGGAPVDEMKRWNISVAPIPSRHSLPVRRTHCS